MGWCKRKVNMLMNEGKEWCVFLKTMTRWPSLDNWSISMGTYLLAVSCDKEENWEVNEIQSNWVDLQSMEILTLLLLKKILHYLLEQIIGK